LSLEDPNVEAIAVILACLVASAFFSGSETALLRLRSSEVEAEAEVSRSPAAFAVSDMLQSTSRLLVTILLGNNVVNILGASVASALAVAALGPGTGVLVSTLVMTFLVLVFCEVLPKAFAATHPKQVSRLVALPLYLFHGALRPIHHVLARGVDALIRRMGGGAEAGGDVTSEDVLALARRAGAQSNGAGPAQIMSSLRVAPCITALCIAAHLQYA